MTREKQIILSAKVISLLFTPFYLPLLGMLLLFMFTYLSLLPWLYKTMVLTLVYLFTILLPTILIHLYRRYQGWSPIQLSARERRIIPYLISILSYLCLAYIMHHMHMPHLMAAIVVAALLVQVACAIINVWWKISTHMAAIGGLVGALLVFSQIFIFNPIYPLCLILIVAGLLGSSRIILRQHTLPQVVGGFLIGTLCTAVGVLFY
ncbi:MAG: hypothetical protein IJP74_03405 [Prevotella sp.]|nr:hypothetical protein [Prevotella sp.]